MPRTEVAADPPRACNGRGTAGALRLVPAPSPPSMRSLPPLAERHSGGARPLSLPQMQLFEIFKQHVLANVKRASDDKVARALTQMRSFDSSTGSRISEDEFDAANVVMLDAIWDAEKIFQKLSPATVLVASRPDLNDFIDIFAEMYGIDKATVRTFFREQDFDGYIEERILDQI